MNNTEQNTLRQTHGSFVRGYTMATLDSMYMAACQAAPWRKEDWKTLRHDLEEALAADWRREDQETNKLARALEHATAHTKHPYSDSPLPGHRGGISQKAEPDILHNGDQSAVPEECRMHPANWPQ